MPPPKTDESVMLTTIDNPWNPHSNWEEWFAYDEAAGYHSSGLLARFTITSLDQSDKDYEESLLNGLYKLISLNPMGIHKLIRPNEDPKPVPINVVTT